MANHYSSDPVETEQPSEPTQLREPIRRISGDTTGMTTLPYGQSATYHYSYPTAMLSDDYYEDEVPSRGGVYMVGRGAILMLAWAFRLLAFAGCLLVIANVLSLSWGRHYVTLATDAVTACFPWQSTGLLSVDTPFGGVFRGDLAILTLLLFVIDWALCRVRTRLL